MPRKKLPSEWRGLGAEHKRRRRNMPPPEGDPCPFCREPMWPGMQLDLDHVIPRAHGGADGPVRWAHSLCNRREGGRLGARMRKKSNVRSRKW